MRRSLISCVRPAVSKIYNHLPLGKFKEWMRSRFYKLTSIYALSKIVRDAELQQNGILFVELIDGTKFYGEQDKIQSKMSILHRIDKFKGLTRCDGILGLLCYEYVTDEYTRYYKLKKGDFVIDAGANIGTFTIKAARMVGNEGRVIAIEPGAENLKLLRRNIEVNMLSNIIVIPKGVWSTKGILKFNLSWSPTAHSFYKDDYYGTQNTSNIEDVKTDTIDNILKELGIKRVDFIKMDIEGAEIEALRGMEETLRNNDVKLAIEAIHIVNKQETYKIIVPSLEEKGFEIHKEGENLYAHKKAL